MFDVLEMQKIVEGEARITFVPKGGELLPQLLAAEPGRAPNPPPLKQG